MKTLLLCALPLALASCDAAEAPKPAIQSAPVEKARDPVCRMDVPKATSLKHAHEGKDYFFCAQGCVDKFKSDPRKFTP